MSPSPEIRVVPLTLREQFRDAVALQKEVWQFEDSELLPVRLFVVATKVGGQAFGAYHQRDMVGFALAIPGIKPGYGAYLHGHMVGVSAKYRNCGVGRMLKLRQREDAVARNVELMEWTFDPLEIKNAHFNIERLGAIIRRYVLNQYGKTTSALHGGLPTDRCIAEWWMNTERVQQAVRNEPWERPKTELSIAVPSSIALMRERDPMLAKQVQARVSQEFTEAFDRGLAVIGFRRTESNGEYLLGRSE